MAHQDKHEVATQYLNAVAVHEAKGWVIRLSRTGDTRIISGSPAPNAALAWKAAWLLLRNPSLAAARVEGAA